MQSAMIRRDKAVVVVIDMQERLLPVMKNQAEIARKAAMLIRGAKILGTPILVTEQYPKGLGKTVPEIQEALGEFRPIEKTSFSVLGEPNFIEAFKELNRQDVIICGIESHVCIEQSALDFLNQGCQVYIMEDAVGSRSDEDKEVARRRMTEAGCIGTTVEAALFELVGDAKDPSFKEISNLVK
ncbi:MAG: hydrolase [Clostridia bacterium]|nr:hydrolase [Clostridia bacterium]